MDGERGEWGMFVFDLEGSFVDSTVVVSFIFFFFGISSLSPKAHSTIKRFGVNYDRTFIFDKIHHEINQFCSANSLHEVYISRFSTLDESLAAAIQVIFFPPSSSCFTFLTRLFLFFSRNRAMTLTQVSV